VAAVKTRQTENNIVIKGGFAAPVYRVAIYPNENNAGGFWAKCFVGENGCAYTDGDTIEEIQINMYESVALSLEDDSDIIGFSLEFTVSDKPADE
jgi:predicted RNase H-like HicB family nuclease